jgi:pimeloyl-ACP methyl ester carboxylesterase
MELKVDGKTAFVAVEGKVLDRERTSILFVHGAGLDHTVWPLPMRYFARHGRNVLAVDLPGHGRSEGPALETIEAMGDWLVAVLDAAGLAQSAFVGHSMGSLVTLAGAGRHPARARALVLIGSSAPMPVHERLLSAAHANAHGAIDMLNIWGHSLAGQIGGVGAPGLWKTGSALRLWEQAAPGVIYADLKACNDYKEGPAHAAHIRCPTLVIIGDRDIMTPPSAGRKLASAIVGSRTVVIRDSGHALLEEQPNAVLDALIEIL